MRTSTAFLRAMRPKQWVKNILVLTVPLAAGELLEPGVLGPALLALVAFCLVSSAVYLGNDVADVEVDRVHPVKMSRPVAAGAIAPRQALVGAAVLLVVGLALGLLASVGMLLLLVGYVALQVCYSLWLKNEPVLDICIVAAGFLLRAVAGGLASDIPISQWFLMVAGFGSLFIVAGKRYSELHTLGTSSGTRRSLVRYTDTYLRFAWSVAAGATLMAYSLWAFQNEAHRGMPWATVSIAPFTIGMLRYAIDIDAGKAAAPEDIVWTDRVLQVIGLVWLVTATLGVLHV